jgi:mitotic spindle assembly checkpoint protein MAD1
MALESKKNLIQALRAENEKLRSGSSNQAVSSESLNVFQQDIESLKAEVEARDKRILRLKQVFGAKVQEYLEAVSDTLGYKIDVNEGRVKLSSIYNRHGDPSLIYIMNGDEKGHVEFEGGNERSLAKVEGYIKDWMDRKSLPCILSAMTMGLYQNK